MSPFLKLFFSILLLLVSFGVGLGVMVFGWGLTVVSWPVIIGGFVWSMINASAFIALGKA